MATHTQKRPRLSLQIKALSSGPSIRTSRTLAAVINPSSPTSFNTLSNVYSTAIDRSMPSDSSRKRLAALPRLKVPDAAATAAAAAAAAAATPAADHRSHTPYITTQLPETPLTAQPLSASQSGPVADAIHFPSAALLTSTPPLSAGPVDLGAGAGTAHPAFCLSPDATTDRFDSMPSMVPDEGRYSRSSSTSSSTSSTGSTGSTGSVEAAPTTLLASPPLVTAKPSRRIANLLSRLPPPYKHPRSLRSILRNSPLPPVPAKSPVSPRRQSQRLADRASRHVMYHSPLTQTITTNTYTRSHIDLLCEDASPASATQSPVAQSPVAQSPSSPATSAPLGDVRRRMTAGTAGNAGTAGSPVANAPPSPGGIRKRKQPSRREKKRRWVWTLGQDDDEENEEHMSGAMAALRAAQAAEAKREEEKKMEAENAQNAQKQMADVEMHDSVPRENIAIDSRPLVQP